VRIAIMGSGGVGGYFGARLVKGGADVHFIARGSHLAAMREHLVDHRADRSLSSDEAALAVEDCNLVGVEDLTRIAPPDISCVKHVDIKAVG